MRLLNKAVNRFFLSLEQFFSANWFNPFATIYLNLRSLPLSKALRLPIWVYGRPRIMALSGKIKIEAPVRSGMIRFNYTNKGPSNMGVQSEIMNFGTIIFKGTAKIRTGNRIAVGIHGVLEFGDRLIIGDMINIGCYKSITIGSNVRIAHRSQLFDTNYHFVANLNKHVVPPVMRPIVIGDNCWICNSCLISAGTHIPDYTIVSTNSLVNKDFSAIEEGSILGGIPAKPIASGFKLVNNVTKEQEIIKFYATHDSDLYLIPDTIVGNDWFKQI